MIYSRDFSFAIYHFFFYYTYVRNYWRGLYFRVSLLSRIYAKIKSSWIKSVLQYLLSLPILHDIQVYFESNRHNFWFYEILLWQDQMSSEVPQSYKDTACFLSSFVKFCSKVTEEKWKICQWIRDQSSHLYWWINQKTQSWKRKLSTCFQSNFVKFCSAVSEKSNVNLTKITNSKDNVCLSLRHEKSENCILWESYEWTYDDIWLFLYMYVSWSLNLSLLVIHIITFKLCHVSFKCWNFLLCNRPLSTNF